MDIQNDVETFPAGCYSIYTNESKEEWTMGYAYKEVIR